MVRHRVVSWVDDGTIARASTIGHQGQNSYGEVGQGEVEVALVANGGSVKTPASRGEVRVGLIGRPGRRVSNRSVGSRGVSPGRTRVICGGTVDALGSQQVDIPRGRWMGQHSALADAASRTVEEQAPGEMLTDKQECAKCRF